MAQQHLTSIIPFAEDLDIHRIIRIRLDEPDAFIQYRAALNKTIDEFRAKNVPFTSSDAKQLYSDVLLPKLTSLDQKIKPAKRDSSTKMFRNATGIVAAISFGMFSGLVPAETIEAAKILGFGKLAVDFIEKLMSSQDSTKSIINEDMFFLWKVRNTTPSR